MAPRSGCQKCRKRHIRCLTEEGATSCNHCLEQHRECKRVGRFRFKIVRSAPQRKYGETGKVSFVYSPTQTWVRTPTIIDFVTDPCLLDDDAASTASSPASSQSVDTEWPLTEDLAAGHNASEEPINNPPRVFINETDAVSALLNLRNIDSSTGFVIDSSWQTPISGCDVSSSCIANDISLHQNSSPYSPGIEKVSDSTFSFLSPTSEISASGRSSFGTTAQLTNREVVLLRNYIENVSPWVDAGDPLSHFRTLVPRRAMQYPILLNAIFAISAQNMSLTSTYDEAEGPRYHNKCISLLIPAISEENCDENVLAATVILRCYEEMSVEDNRCHLLGSTRLLNSFSRFLSSGGLGEAAAWVVLRQVIYISLVSKEPMAIRLENYKQSQSSLKGDDYSWSNMMVLLCAKILDVALLPSRDVTTAEWLLLETEIEDWNQYRPDSFNTLSVQDHHLTEEGSVQEIWMLGASHVVGVQHFCLAKILFQAYNSISSRSGFEFLRAIREQENAIRANVRVILGLALGNPKVQNGWFTTSHTLFAFGCYLQHTEERRVALEFLNNMRKTIGWKSQIVATLLRDQWGVLDEYNGS